MNEKINTSKEQAISSATNTPHTGCLVLAPRAINPVVPELATLLTMLERTGFIGPALTSGTRDFLVGDAFLQLITFMGCSPWLELTPPAAGGSFCHICIDGPWAKPNFIYGSNTKGPGCCKCRRRLNPWHDSLANWLKQLEVPVVICPHCDHPQRPLDLSWRREAGFGRLFIRIENIFPGEAVPVPVFLQELQQCTVKTPWEYFYVSNYTQLKTT